MFRPSITLPSILIVDDSPSILKLLHTATKDLGKVYFATNGIEAVIKAKEIRPELVLLDIEMPDLSGYEVFTQIKSLPGLENVAVIFITSHQAQEHELKTLEMGGADYITKPINIPVTRARVKTQLTLHQQKTSIQRHADEMSLVLSAIPAHIAYWDSQGINVFCNDKDGQWFKKSASDIHGKHFSEAFPTSVSEKIDVLIQDKTAISAKQSIDVSYSINDSIRHGQATVVPYKKGTLSQGYLTLITDITSRKIAEQCLIDEKERIRITLNSIGDAVIATDTQGTVTFLNPIAEDMTGWYLGKAIGKPIEEVMPLLDATTGAPMPNPIRTALKEQRIVGMALNCALGKSLSSAIAVEDSAAPIVNHENETTGAIIVFHDVSEARAMAIKMTHLAQHDPLTNLPNRLLLRDRALQSIKHSAQSNKKLAMVMIDLDDFKAVNELVGHDAGDLVLQQVAYELKNELNLEGNLFRPGGDEFLIILSHLTSSIQVTRFIHKLMSLFQSTWETENHHFKLSVSIGVSVYPEDSQDFDELYRHSESALFSAKSAGKNQFKFYNQKLEKKLILRQRLEQSLKTSDAKQQFEIHYQPKVDIDHQRVQGVEALVRWRDEEGKLVSPNDFIPICEESGLIISLGEFVLRKACEQTVKWLENGLTINMAVNVSVIQFEDSKFLFTLNKIIQQTGIPPHLLELELTESILAKDIDYARKLIEDIRSLGVRIALDDFGTGYSSLSYINGFPIDVLKIDQSFVRNMLRSQTDLTIIAAIIQMAEGLHLKLIAEGVETQEHAYELKRMGCKLMQGYFFSKPITADEMTLMLKESACANL